MQPFRQFLSILIFILNSVLLTATAADSSSLLIWTSNEGAARAINELKSSFEEEYGLKVQVEVLNKDLTSLFKTASLTGKGPDILFWANDVSGELAQSGLIEPLDEIPLLTENFLPVSLKAFRYKGRLYGYPLAIESVVLFYNPDLVKEPVKTFEDLYVEAKKLTNSNSGHYGFLFDFKSFFFAFPVLNASGGYIFGETAAGLNAADVGINHPGFVSGLKYLQKLKQEGLIPGSTDRGIAFEKFKTGKLAYTIDGPWAIKDLEAAKASFKLSVLPSMNNGAAKPFVGVQGFMIRRSSKHKLAAKEFIERSLLTAKGMKLFYQYDNRVPARLSVLEELSNKDQKLIVLRKSAEIGIAMPNIPQMSSVWGAMGKALSLSIDQNMDPKAALDLVRPQIK